MQNAQKVYCVGKKKVAFVQTSGKLLFSGDSFSPTRGYLYLADVWGHFLIATNGGQERRQVAVCSTAEASPNNNCQTPKRINSKGVKKKTTQIEGAGRQGVQL